MKKIFSNNRIIAIAFLTVFSVALAPVAMATEKKPAVPAELVFVGNIKPLRIKSIGHGSRQMCRVDKFGFPRSKAKSGKEFFGFQTHDIVKFKSLECRIKSVRKTGSFTLENKDKDINSSYKNLQILQHADGYSYNYQTQPVK